ncbi:hypothetical protein [Streptomyces anulatus]|uniref:hypothetical protein n=1 Tax=Streptomyces anulatus TaxID=1892 RepID=UPI002ED681D6|nr:hypothetical protein OG703_17100 [Streptomyces anulatus]
MHTPTASTAPFTLAFWKEGRTHEQRAGYRGTAAEFGEIVLTAPLPRKYTPDRVVSEVRGPSVPTAVFETRGIHTEAADLPTLNRSVLRVGDAMVHLRRNRFGLTRRARALHFRYGGDHYRLRAVNRKQFVLVRRADDEDPGVSLTAKLSGIGGRKLVVRTAGRAVAADIVLVTLFAGVDRAPLTRSGAVRAALGRSTRLFAESQA